MRRADARLRRTDAHNLKYIIVMDMDGSDGLWMELCMLVDFGWVLDGFGMVFGCILPGFLLVFGSILMDFGWNFDGSGWILNGST